jgi:hypothetical protein
MSAALPIVQLIAYVTLTLASIIIGAVSAFIAYRSNFSWKPLVLVTSHGFRGKGGSQLVDASIEYEIWNRQRYPILIRSMDVHFKSISIRAGDVEHPWLARGSSILNTLAVTLSPDTHERIKAFVPMKEGTHLDDLEDNITIEIFYFDPRRNKDKTLRVRHSFKFSTP